MKNGACFIARAAAVAALALGVSFLTAQEEKYAAPKSGVATVDDLNVRGQPTIHSEVLTQVHSGDRVRVLGEIERDQVQGADPARWYRIDLPAGVSVWVSGLYIDEVDSTVTASLLNVRGGPSEKFSVLDRIPRGTKVNVLSQKDDWMEIEQTPGAAAYLAAKFVDLTSQPPPPKEKETFAEKTRKPGPKKPAEENRAKEPSKPETSEQEIAKKPDETAAPAEEVAETASPGEEAEAPPAESASDEEAFVPLVDTQERGQPVEVAETPEVREDLEPLTPSKRIVTREGAVARSGSIQAPGRYALKNIRTGKLMNFLYSPQQRLRLNSLLEKEVRVTGQELVDERWPSIPILEIEKFQVVRR